MLGDELSVVDGTTFAVSDPLGDMRPGDGHGFFREDTRFLSVLALTINGARPVLLSRGNPSHRRAGRRSYAVRFQSRAGGAPVATVIRASVRPRLEAGRLAYRLRLAPQQSWQVE